MFIIEYTYMRIAYNMNINRTNNNYNCIGIMLTIILYYTKVLT